MIDHVKDECIIKLIDMSYIEYYVDQNKRDQGFLFGLKSLRTVLCNID